MPVSRTVVARRSTMMLVVLSVVLIAAADFLFYRAVAGWTLGLYALLLMVAIGTRAGWARPGRATAAVVLLLLGLVAALMIQPGPLPVAMAAMGLVALAAAARAGWTASVAAWVARLVGYVAHTPTQPIADARLARRRGDHHRRPSLLARFLRNWALPIGLGVVFIGLFWMANPVIGSWLDAARQRLAAWAQGWGDLVAPGRLLLWLVVGFGVWTLLRYRPRRGRVIEAARPAREIDRRATVPLVVRCLALFNVIFAVQNILDGWYLYGDGVLPEGMTYAEYAHRGAYPLVATALLAGAFVLTTFRAGGAAERSATARRLVYLWIGQNILLLISAAWRLRLYVDVYSLTLWRLSAAIWMLLVALGLLWTVWRIVRGRSNVWLLRVNVVTGLAVLYVCCFLDLAGMIAHFNVSRCREVGGPGVPIDLPYLESLGAPALPAVRWLETHAIDRKTAEQADVVTRRLQARLDRQLDNWRGWTLHRARLAAEHAPAVAAR